MNAEPKPKRPRWKRPPPIVIPVVAATKAARAWMTRRVMRVLGCHPAFSDQPRKSLVTH